MKLFISHARKDNLLALDLASRLDKAGIKVWNAEQEIAPGDNWAKQIGNALDEAEFIVILLTPKAMESDWLRQEIEYAIGSKKYAGRVFTVFVGPTLEAGRDVPWILLKLPHLQIDSSKKLGSAVKKIGEQLADSNLSHTNA